MNDGIIWVEEDWKLFLRLLARRFSHWRTDALGSEDLVQEGVTAAFMAEKDFNGRGNKMSFLYTVAERRAITLLREYGRKMRKIHTVSLDDPTHMSLGTHSYHEIIPDNRENPEELVVREESNNELSSLLASLPNKKRAVVELRMKGCTPKEVAAELGLARSTVYAHLRSVRLRPEVKKFCNKNKGKMRIK